MIISIVFDDQEYGKISSLAEEIQKNKKNKRIVSKKINPHLSDLSICEMGIMGECATALLLGVSIDSRIFDRGDGGVDLSYRGKTVSVKTTRTGWDFALINSDDRGVKDINVLCWKIDCRTVEVVGYLPAEIFRQKHKIKDYGYGNRYVCEAKYFRPLTHLLRG